jgi:predicted transcriptional regulator of viral defense system
MIYSHFYVGLLKSVSIRIIEEIRKSPNDSMTIKEIKNIYPVDEMVRTRLSLLEENGWLSKVGEDYFCLKKALRTVKINLYLHKVFRLENTG